MKTMPQQIGKKMKKVIYASNTKEVSALELEARKLAYNAALEAIVMLENDGVLPLKETKIALFGAGAKQTIKGGLGSGEVNERYSVSIYSGLLNNGFQITTEAWIDDYEQEYQNNLAVYNHLSMNPFTIFNDTFDQFDYPVGRLIREDDVDTNTNVAIYVASRQTTEGKDKKLDKNEYSLKDTEIENIKFLKEHYEKVILVINSGVAMDLTSIDDCFPNAILYVAGLGCEGGNALASILKGEASPSAKLTSTWPYKYSDIPFGDEYSYLNGVIDKEYYKEDIYVGYRYFDTFKKDVRYGFGYGLSYTSFSHSYTNFQVNGSIVSYDCLVKNVGNIAGKDVIEAYISMPGGELKKEYRRLISFGKTRCLAPGEEEIIHISFDLKDASSFMTSMASYVLEKGLYLIWSGDSLNTSKIIFGVELDRTYYPYKVANLVKLEEKMDLLEPASDNQYDIDNNLVILKASGIEEVEVSYDLPKIGASLKAKTLVEGLSTSEKIDLCVGMGIKGMLDTDGIYTPGAVGKTTTKLFNKGIINVNLCDGPAGLRILQESALNKRGKLKFVEGNYPTSILHRIPKWLRRPFMEGKKDNHLYQYATAYPVGICLAQSFNKDLCKQIGKMISKEMTKYGITYFLGPALNIHRNPLCGRNFEYYSEDPLVSGMIASSIASGVLEIEGNYPTIKHFACNNTEENRQHSNSIVSERALREIYLKGFEKCIRDTKTSTLMSSYNIINGEYAGNRYDLNMQILRCEWGFRGIVMSDWFETGKGRASAARALASGVDLIMPGSKWDKKDIKQGLKKGSVAISDLNRACLMICEQIITSKVYKDYEESND